MNFKKIADTNFKFTFKKIISFDAANAFDISITGLKFTIFAAYLSCMGLDFQTLEASFYSILWFGDL